MLESPVENGIHFALRMDKIIHTTSYLGQWGDILIPRVRSPSLDGLPSISILSAQLVCVICVCKNGTRLNMPATANTFVEPV